MSREPSPEIDDELFNEVYGKEYTGPPRPTSVSAVNTSSNKLLIDETKNRNDGNDDDMAPDPNAVPTDFTSREARVWEAKAKAIERNWKKRKEEELICKLCGEAGHFTQGCPSTLGANRKKADFFERVPARDKQVRSLFTEKVIAQIEKDVGCKIKLEEKFLIVSGKDRLILSKGVDAVHKLIQDDKNKNSGQSSISPVRAPRSRSPVRAPRSRSPIRAPRSRSPIRAPRSRSPIRLRRSRSPVRPPKLRSPVHLQRSKSPNHVQSPVSSYFSRHSESQRPHSSPRNPSRYQVRSLIQDRVVENRVREDLQKFSSDAPYAYANDGSRGQLARSRSPAHSNLIHDHGSFDGHNHSLPKTDNWNMERRGNDFQTEKRFDYPNPNPNPHNYEELELEFKRECMEVGRIRDHEEDEENIKHRECVQGLREGYLKKLDMLRNMHMKQWEEFLQLDIQKKNQQIHHNSPAYMEYNQARDPSFLGGTNLPIDSRNQPPYLNEEFPASMQHNFYGGDVQGQGQRNDEFGRTYGRY